MQTYCRRGREEENFSELHSSFDAMGWAVKRQEQNFDAYYASRVRSAQMRNALLTKQFVNLAQCDRELICVIGRGQFELLEQSVDCGADFGGRHRLRFFAVRDVE